MSTQRDPLLVSIGAEETQASNHSRRCCPPALSKRYKSTCVTTKGALVALVWSAIINGLGSSIWTFYSSTIFDTMNYVTLLSLLVHSFTLMLYPAAALVGELRWTRFKSLILGSLMVVIGGLLLSIKFLLGRLAALSDLSESLLTYLETPIMMIGLALFQSNAIQYGIEQLNFASSEVLSSFVFWYYWTCCLLPGIKRIGVATIDFQDFNRLPQVSSYLLNYVFPSAAGLVILVLLCITICCCCWYPELRMNQGHGVNPVKLIWRVMQFARKNKHPPLRSAFTYSELPSRLDLAKKRYGGPFTTWEVEDVKSFWRILLLLVALIGFQFRDDATYLSFIWVFLQPNIPYIPDPFTFTALVMIVYVPVYQLVVRPYFFRCIPTMITRMKLGLFLVLVSLLITTAYSALVPLAVDYYVNVTSYYCVDNNCAEIGSYIVSSNFSLCLLLQHLKFDKLTTNISDGYILSKELIVKAPPVAYNVFWMITPQVLNGLASILVFLTVLEFILAQAPSTMRGFLIGLWYAMESIHIGLTGIGNFTCVRYHWEYYAAKSLLVLLSTILFLGVARKYKYRKLNEDVDVNIQRVIEDVFERNFDREEIFYHQQLRDSRACLVETGEY